MQHTAMRHDPNDIELIQDMDTIIAKRPEWRFLEQQRHLKDVVRLLLRETQSHHYNFSSELKINAAQRSAALTSSWLCLIISQELQFPPQLTQLAFTYTFYRTLLSETQKENVFAILEQTTLNHFGDEGLEKIEMMFTLCSEMQRLQTCHFSWEKPWYVIRPCLFFLNNHINAHWIRKTAELMLLLQQHDSLISNGAAQEQFSPQQLHTSHPLRKKATLELETLTKQYQSLTQTVLENQEALSLFLQKNATKKPELKKIETALQHITDAWKKTNLVQETRQSSLEQAHALFSEAAHQRTTLSIELAPLFKTLKLLALCPQEQQLCDTIQKLFEV